MRSYPVRLSISMGAVLLLTWVSHSFLHVNATTAGFLYLLLILIVASTWGFVEAAALSVAASFLENYYFFPPVGTLTIADPQNSIALFSFLIVSLIASRLSTKAKRRAQDAIERQQDIERLYTLSRSILLIGSSESFQNELIGKVAEAFGVNAVILYDRRSGEFFRAGPSDFESMDQQLRDSAAHGTAFFDAKSDSGHSGRPPWIRADRKPGAARLQNAGHGIAGHCQSGRDRTGAGKGAGSGSSGDGGAAK